MPYVISSSWARLASFDIMGGTNPWARKNFPAGPLNPPDCELLAPARHDPKCDSCNADNDQQRGEEAEG